MDLKQLSYFVKIVEEGSISGAAKKSVYVTAAVKQSDEASGS